MYDLAVIGAGPAGMAAALAAADAGLNVVVVDEQIRAVVRYFVSHQSNFRMRH